METSTEKNILSIYMQMKGSARERILKNRDPIFRKLKDLKINSVTITYSGSGDSGCIDEIILSKNNESLNVNADVKIFETKSCWNHEKSQWDDITEENSVSLEKAIEILAYDCLESEQPGWEINEGSYGEFILDILENTIELQHTNYYTEIETTEHYL